LTLIICVIFLFQSKRSVSVDGLLPGQDGLRHRVNIIIFFWFLSQLFISANIYTVVQWKVPLIFQ